MTTAQIGYRAVVEREAPAVARARRFDLVRRLARRRGALGGLVILVLVLVVAALASVIAPFNPIGIDPTHALYSPGLPYLFGTDQYGRDVFSRVVFGSRVSLMVGPIAVGIALAPGIAMGLLSGYYGRWVDGLLMRMVDVMLAFPGILLALGIVAVLGPSLSSLMVAVGISSIPTYARLTRGSVLAAR